jgi:hypothetical protein
MNTRNNSFLLAAILVAAAIAGIAANGQSAVAAGGGSRTNGIVFDKNNFSNSLNIDNKYFPLKSGTTFTYKGTSDGTPTKDVVVVTDKTKDILGVTARVVHDTVYENGKATEVTDDWYAQDNSGNVWYLGESTKDLESGSTEGSWEAGVNGAKPGIIMEANPPQVGDTYYQEFLNGVAEDQAKVIQLDASVCVPYGCFNNVLITKEFTALEPGVVDHKYYAPGIGDIKEETIQGSNEKLELVSVKT